MAWWMVAAAAMGAMQFAGAEANLMADEAKHKAQKAWQTYSNTMVRLSDSMNQNAITQNEILANEAFADQAMQLKRDSLFTLARAETAAAAAGVKGRSVNQAMFDVKRNAAIREDQRQRSLRNARLAFDQQRLQSRMSAEMQQDYTYLPKPQAASYYLQAAMNTLSFTSSMAGGSGGSGGSGGGSYQPQTINNPNIAGTSYML